VTRPDRETSSVYAKHQPHGEAVRDKEQVSKCPSLVRADRLSSLLTAKRPPAASQAKPAASSRSAHARHAPAAAAAAEPTVAPGVRDDAMTGASSVAECQAVIRRLQAENQRQAAEVVPLSVFAPNPYKTHRL